MKQGSLLFTLLAALAFASPVDAREIKGRARVVDRDTLYVGQVKVRLNGIDAPERGQARFRAATRALKGFVAGKVVVCRLNGDRSYDRYIGSCYVDGYDLAAAVISTGNALDCPRYSGGRYRKSETADARRYIRQAPYC